VALWSALDRRAREARSISGILLPQLSRGIVAATAAVSSLRLLLPLLVLALAASPTGQEADQATVAIDAATIANRISPRLYGQFAEFMFENIKFGLHAELLRNRGFEEPANGVGLPRHWERHPDDRNDESIRFRWDDSVAYPPSRSPASGEIEHSLRLELPAHEGPPRGIFQGHVPVRAGIEYRGYLWLHTWDFAGRLTAVLEQDRTGGHVYASADVTDITADGTWQRYRFTLRPAATDALARLALLFAGRGRVWIDQVSLIPGDAVDDVRADVFERVKVTARRSIAVARADIATGVASRSRRSRRPARHVAPFVRLNPAGLVVNGAENGLQHPASARRRRDGQ
jgi:hypothetical protein